MDPPYSLQEQLARHRVEREGLDAQTEAKAGYQRMLDYRQGVATANDIIGRVAMLGTTHERNSATLRQGVAQQPDSLAGRVAAGTLADAAGRIERDTPDTQAEARRLAALERLEAAAAIRREREAAARSGRRDRGIDRER